MVEGASAPTKTTTKNKFKNVLKHIIFKSSADEEKVKEATATTKLLQMKIPGNK